MNRGVLLRNLVASIFCKITFILSFFMFDGSGFLISFDICSIGYHRLFILLLVEITFYMTVSQ